MLLNGVNNKCARYINECKQWKQVKVIICPKFVDITKKDANSKNHVDAKHSKTLESGSTATPGFKKGKPTIIYPKSNLEPKNANSMADRSV